MNVFNLSCLLVLYWATCHGHDQLELFDGINAVEGEFPYMVSLRYAWDEHDCGGSIIGDKWILTAGHCSMTSNVKYGTIKLDQYHYDPDHTIGVKNYFPHPNLTYVRVNQTWGYITNDIAIYELEEPLPYGPNVQPVQLPPPGEEPPYNKTGLLCGWGFTTQTGDVSDILQKINVTTYDEDYCIHNSMGLYANDETNTCGGSDKVGRGVCYQDSGSPYVIDGVQYGVLAWMTVPCGSHVVGFSRVSYYRDWITNITGI